MKIEDCHCLALTITFMIYVKYLFSKLQNNNNNNGKKTKKLAFSVSLRTAIAKSRDPVT